MSAPLRRTGRRLGTIRRLTPRRRRLLLEAAAELTRATVELGLRPGDRMAGALGVALPSDAEASIPSVDTAPSRAAAEVGWAVRGVARALPWRPTCLRQALAARRMLDRRGIPAVVHLGVVDARLEVAHAWVTAGARVVVGGGSLDRFTTVASFTGRVAGP